MKRVICSFVFNGNTFYGYVAVTVYCVYVYVNIWPKE